MILIRNAFKYLPRLKEKAFDTVVMCLWENPTMDQLRELVRHGYRIARHNVIIETVANIDFHRACVLAADYDIVDEPLWIKSVSTNHQELKWRPGDNTERILVLRHGRDSFYRPIITNSGRPSSGRAGKNVTGLRYQPQTLFGPNHRVSRAEMGVPEELQFRPQPIWLLEQLFYCYVPPGGTVFEVGAGAGTGLIAASRLGLDYNGIEIDPRMAGAAVQRFSLLDTEPVEDPTAYITNQVAQHNNKFADLIRRVA